MTITTRPGRGRPKGTGLDDSAHIAAIARRIAAEPGLKPTTAIRQLGITDPSVIRRLRDKYSAHVETLHDGLVGAAAEDATVVDAVADAAVEAHTAPRPVRTMAAAVAREPRIVEVPAPVPALLGMALPAMPPAKPAPVTVAPVVEVPRVAATHAEAAPVVASSAVARSAEPAAEPAVAEPVPSVVPVIACPVAAGMPAQPAELTLAGLVGLGVAVWVTGLEAQASLMAYCLRQVPMMAIVQTQVAVAEAALALTVSSTDLRPAV
jgi:hypothetical protein